MEGWDGGGRMDQVLVGWVGLGWVWAERQMRAVVNETLLAARRTGCVELV